MGAAACGSAGRALVSVVTTVEYTGKSHSFGKPLFRLRPCEGHLPSVPFLLLSSPDGCHVSLQATLSCRLSYWCIRLRYSMRQQCLLQMWAQACRFECRQSRRMCSFWECSTTTGQYWQQRCWSALFCSWETSGGSGGHVTAHHEMQKACELLLLSSQAAAVPADMSASCRLWASVVPLFSSFLCWGRHFVTLQDRTCVSR